ncbi:MAG: DNA-binding protein [Myxococcales bacterium]|nr:DNA-binding protein [Myxococcales bacterium]
MSSPSPGLVEERPPESRRKERRSERRRPGKKGRRRSRTIATKRLSKEELALAEELRTVDVDRPKARSECVTGVRPCPYVSCKHHLYLDVNPETGSIKLNFPDLEVWEMIETCALDVADRGGITLEEVGEILNLTRERIRQVEVKGLQKLRETAADLGLQDFLSFLENHISID